MFELKIEGTVRTVENKDQRKADVELKKGRILIGNTDGVRVTITGSEFLTEGFNPEEAVLVTIVKAQTKLPLESASSESEETGEVA